MRRIISLLFIIAVAGLLFSCGTENTGDFKIRLRLPIDNGDCWDDYGDDTYCINPTDQILLTIYSTPDLRQPYEYTDRRLFRVRSTRGQEEFIRSLRSENYYRFFVEVTNANEKLKLTGGIEGIYYDDSRNYEVNLFLGAVGDFVRVVKDRANFDATSLKSYFEFGAGSSGSGATALKNGNLFLSGGYYYEEYMNNAMIFDMPNLTSKEVSPLRVPLKDHAVALLEDDSSTGKVVIAFGEGEGGFSSEVLIYDPESDRYQSLGHKEPLTMARALTIDGEVYIVGGCTPTAPHNKVYKVTKNGELTEYATLRQGRCNHSVADISTTDEEGNINVRLLVLGGSTDAKGENPIANNDNFAEIVTNNVSNPVNIEDRNGEDNAELLSRGLVSSAATRLSWDDRTYGPEVAVVSVGGYLMGGEGDSTFLLTNPNLFIFTEKEGDPDTWVYDINGAPNRCARPSISGIAAGEMSISQFAAVNCGTDEIRRDSTDHQIIFVVQVRKSYDTEYERTIYSASVRDTLMEENRDPLNGVIIDGPTTTNALGQAFVFGTEYVYQISGFAVPE